MKNRIETFSEILRYASQHHIRLNRFWGSFIETARFKLGESIKDIKIPFALSSDASDIISEAFKDFIDLLQKRLETQFKNPEDRAIDDFDQKSKLPPKTFLIRFHRPESVEYQIISRCLQTDPLLDAGIFESWLSPKNSGKSFLDLIQKILNKTFIEEIKSEHFEKTSYIVHLAIIKRFIQAKSIIKEVRIKGAKYEQLDVTCANLLYVTLDTIFQNLIDTLKSRRLPMDMNHTFLLISSTCHPVTFTSIKQSITRGRFNPYNISQELIDVLDPIYRKVSQKNTDLSFVQPAMVDKIISSSKIKNSVLEEAALLTLRLTFLNFLFEYDNAHIPLVQSLRELAQDQNKLVEFIFNSKAVDQLADQVKKASREDIKDQKRSQQLEEIENLLRLIHKGGLLKKTTLLKEMVERMVELYLSYKIDLYLDRFTGEAINLLDDRQAKMSVSQMRQDYESGRLYRISTDPHATLQEFSERFAGQLFIDLKDFTKRTNYSKEIVMADFLGNEFYKPILDAAQKYHSSMDDLSRNIKLINLLGDAVIFSGSIESLVYLAQDIQNLFREYKNKLKASSPSNLEKEIKEPVEAAYKQNLAQIQGAIDRNQIKLESLKKEVSSQIQKNYGKLLENFPQQMNQEITQLETQFLDLDSRINLERDIQRKYEFSTQRNTIAQKITNLRGMQKQYANESGNIKPDQQMALLAKFFFREQLFEIENIEESLETLTKGKNSLGYEFEREIKKIEGFGMDAGLFISFGTAAESIEIRDDIWGDQGVAIAETINESARGTARNQLIKKLLDARLAEQIRLRGNKNLTFPFHVYAEKTYSFQMSPQQSAAFQISLQNNNLPQAEQILHNLLYDSLKDTRDQIQQSGTPGERRTLVILSDIYNEGEAISEEALNAFLRETAATRHHFRRTFPVRKFHKEILEQFLFLDDTFNFVLSIDHERKSKEPLIFRYAGEVTFRGFESRGAIGVYEILKSDSGFYRLLTLHHVADWLKEFDQKFQS